MEALIRRGPYRKPPGRLAIRNCFPSLAALSRQRYAGRDRFRVADTRRAGDVLSVKVPRKVPDFVRQRNASPRSYNDGFSGPISRLFPILFAIDRVRRSHAAPEWKDSNRLLIDQGELKARWLAGKRSLMEIRAVTHAALRLRIREAREALDRDREAPKSGTLYRMAISR